MWLTSITIGKRHFFHISSNLFTDFCLVVFPRFTHYYYFHFGDIDELSVPLIKARVISNYDTRFYL